MKFLTLFIIVTLFVFGNDLKFQSFIGFSNSNQFLTGVDSNILLNAKSLNHSPKIEIQNSVTISEDSNITITFTYTDFENDKLNISILKSGQNGKLTKVKNDFLYIPNHNFFGNDEVSIKFDDGFGGIVKKNIAISVLAVDDSPIFLSKFDNFEINIFDVDSDLSKISFDCVPNSKTIQCEIIDNRIEIKQLVNIEEDIKIEVFASLDEYNISQSFQYKTEKMFIPPEISEIEDIQIESENENYSYYIPLDFYDDFGVSQIITTSSNSDILSISTDLENHQIILNIVSEEVGKSKIEVIVKDDENLTEKTSFQISIMATSYQECLEKAKNSIRFLNPNYLIENLDLVKYFSCKENVYIDWESSDYAILDKDGYLNLPYNDSVIKLVATFRSGNFQAQKSFVFKVPQEFLSEKESVEKAFDYLNFDFIKGNNFNENEIYSDLNFANIKLFDTNISWNISNKIIRKNQDINLTAVATISKGQYSLEKIFNLKIMGTNHHDFEWLTLSRILGKNKNSYSIIYDLELPKISSNGFEIIWTTSDYKIVSNQGTVSRDKIENKYIQLTAKIDNEEKIFTLRVLKIYPKIKLNLMATALIIPNLKNRFSDNGVQASFLNTELFINNQGKNEVKVEIKDFESVVISDFNFSVENNQTIFKIDNGNFTLKNSGFINYRDEKLSLNSEIIGTFTEITKNGFETSFTKISNGEIIQAIVKKEFDYSEIGFNLLDKFSDKVKVEMTKNMDNKIEITVQTILKNDLVIK